MSSSDKSLSVLVIEPYYGGSHKFFLDGLKRLPFEFVYMTLPAYKWKWRMRLSAPYFATELRKVNRRFDRILCSSFVDVATFRGLAPRWVRDVPLLTYYHENQFAYPARVGRERDVHFALTNMTTALASDSLAFNSEYNLLSFLKGLSDLLKISDDLRLERPVETIRKKSKIIPPGIDFSAIDSADNDTDGDAPVVLWNHRWEHDKNPVPFFNALFDLDREGLDFGILLLGESFRGCPPIFREAKDRLSDRIICEGYVEDRDEYARMLRKGSIAVSTAIHEFFGIAMIESTRAGCIPLLPSRLSYPELFPAEFLYEERDLLERLRMEIVRRKRLSAERARELTERFSWEALADDYAAWIIGA